MRRVKGRRYNEERKLNLKKVFALIVAIMIIVLFFVSLKHLFSKDKDALTKEVSTLTTYIAIIEDNKWGVINNKGNEIIKPSYDEMIIIPDKNKEIFVCTYDVDYTTGIYKTKVINGNNKQIMKEFENIEAIENSKDGEVWYEKNVLRFSRNNLFGLVNYDGKEVLPAEYNNIYALDGIENFLILEKNNKKGLYNLATNDIIIEPEYQEIRTLLDGDNSKGFVVTREDGLKGVISLDKKQVLEPKYQEIKNVSDGHCYVVLDNGKNELIDNTGAVLLDKGFDEIAEVNLDRVVIVSNNKYGVLDTSGNKIIDTEYESIKCTYGNYYIAVKDGKAGIISEEKEDNITVPFNYKSIVYNKEANLFIANLDDINSDVLDATFEVKLSNVIISEFDLTRGYLRIYKDSNYSYYNFKLEEKTNIEMLPTNTLFLFKENGKYGYVNKNGQKIVDAKYDDAKEQNQYGYCAVKLNGIWYHIDLTWDDPIYTNGMQYTIHDYFMLTTNELINKNDDEHNFDELIYDFIK